MTLFSPLDTSGPQLVPNPLKNSGFPGDWQPLGTIRGRLGLHFAFSADPPKITLQFDTPKAPSLGTLAKLLLIYGQPHSQQMRPTFSFYSTPRLNTVFISIFKHPLSYTGCFRTLVPKGNGR